MRTFFRIAVVVLAWESTPVLAAGPNPVPLCYPKACPTK
jgi:hypothetical protein